MSEPQATFSEHWHRLAHQRVWLLPNVRVRRQYFRGERWYVIEHPFANRYFRIRPAAYEFIARLSPERTVHEAWEECLQKHPDDAPGQEAVVQLLSQLYLANLIHYPAADDSSQLFERFEKRRQREVRNTLMNVMFMRFPLLDPDNFLNRTVQFVRPFFSWFGAILWLIAATIAGKVALDHAPELKIQSQGILSPDNLPLLYVCLIGLKTIHEFGHAYACKIFGGEVHSMGVMLMIFTPVPFVDATSSWGFRSRWHRMLVGAAGMLVELFIAAIAMLVWANTAPGVLHALAYNLMFIASVSTLVFNLNPLLRFDGYYILSDFAEIPNLHQRATQQLRYLAERYLFNLTKSEPPTRSRSELIWLTTFGILSYAYRVVVFSGILFFVADQFLLLGILMAVAGVISWVVVPLVKFFQYITTSPQLERQRPRSIAVAIGLVAAAVVFFGVIPFPHHVRAPGVLQAQRRSDLASEVDGRIVRVLAVPGSNVAAGAPLLQLENPELEMRIAQASAQREETVARLLQAQQVETANLKPLQQRLQTVERVLQELSIDRSNLVVRASHAGLWVAPAVDDYLGRWVRRGTELGLVVDPSLFEFTAAVSQGDGNTLFERNVRRAEVRLRGQSEQVLKVAQWHAVPAEQTHLPSPALGWVGGGDVAVATDDPQGRKAAEPFFQVEAQLDPASGSTVAMVHGRTGVLRLTLDPEPLLLRWFRQLRQLIQKRYTV